MAENRRDFFKLGAGLVSAAVMGGTKMANAEQRDNSGILEGLGLDAYQTYRKMFFSRDTDAKMCWWYLGTTKMPVPDMGEIVVSQVKTIMAFRGEDIGSNAVAYSWTEIGCFLDVATGQPPTSWFNPATGKAEARRAAFEDGPAKYSIKKTPDSLSVELEQAHAKILDVSVVFAVDGDRISLTQTENKIRAYDTATPNPIKTILKIYSSLSEVRDPSTRSVPASGFYRAGSINPGGGFSVNGLMQKTGTAERLDPTAWERLKGAYPAFFKDDKVDPNWN